MIFTFLLVCLVAGVKGFFVHNNNPYRTFISVDHSSSSSRTLSKRCQQSHLATGFVTVSDMATIEIAEHAHGMPWNTSTYVPFWEWQLQFMKGNLSNFRLVECTSNESAEFKDSDINFDYKDSSATSKLTSDNDDDGDGAASTENVTSRIVSLCFESDEYRKIRMSVFDTSEHCSYNTVFYPHFSYNLPIFGVNLLSKARLQKHLAIIDFQPLHQNENEHAAAFSHLQRAVLDKYPELDGEKDDKIRKLQVFSGDMLCQQYEEEGMVRSHVFPAFQALLRSYVDLVHSTPKVLEDTEQKYVMERHVAFDTYSAARDPCTPLLGSLFGKTWANEFVFGFLYANCEPNMSDYWERNATDYWNGSDGDKANGSE